MGSVPKSYVANKQTTAVVHRCLCRWGSRQLWREGAVFVTTAWLEEEVTDTCLSGMSCAPWVDGLGLGRREGIEFLLQGVVLGC